MLWSLLKDFTHENMFPSDTIQLKRMVRCHGYRPQCLSQNLRRSFHNRTQLNANLSRAPFQEQSSFLWHPPLGQMKLQVTASQNRLISKSNASFRAWKSAVCTWGPHSVITEELRWALYKSLTVSGTLISNPISGSNLPILSDLITVVVDFVDFSIPSLPSPLSSPFQKTTGHVLHSEP